MILNRTNLVTLIRQSNAKKCKEYADDVGFSLAQQKSNKNWEKRMFQAKTFRKKMFTASTNKTWGIVRNAFSQSLAALQATFEG